MEYTKSLKLDVSSGCDTKKVFAKQGDTESRFLSVLLTAGGVPVTLSEGAAVRLRATKPDGTCVLNDCICENGVVTVELTEQLLAVPGLVRADLGIYEGTSLLSTAQFLIHVVRTPIDYEAVESSCEFNALTDALSTIEESAAIAESAAAAVVGCETAAEEANNSAVIANEAAENARAAAEQAEAAAQACSDFIDQEIGDAVDTAISEKVEAKTEMVINAMIGTAGGIAGLDSEGKITPMPIAEDVGAAAVTHTHIISETTGTLPLTRGGTGATTAAAALTSLGAAAEGHQHSTSDLTEGILPVARGGTGASSAALARYALGLGNTSGPLPVANGGTGASTAANALESLGAQPAISDTGWVAIPLEDSIEAESKGGRSVPMYRKIGSHVYLEGCVVVVPPSSGSLLIGTVPSDCAPPECNVYQFACTSGKRIARVLVTSAGAIYLEWCLNFSDGSANSGSSVWVQLNMHYFAE